MDILVPLALKCEWNFKLVDNVKYFAGISADYYISSDGFDEYVAPVVGIGIGKLLVYMKYNIGDVFSGLKIGFGICF